MDGALVAAELVGRRAPTTRPPRSTTASSHAWTARSSKWVETKTAAPRRAGVRDHVERGLGAQRVDTVEGLVEQQHVGVVVRREDDRHPPAHAVAEAGGDAMGGAAEIEPLEQVASAGLPAGRQLAQPGGELEVLPRASRAESGRRRRGSSRWRVWLPATRCGRRGRRRAPRRTVGGMTPASTRIVVDLPAPFRPTRAVAPPLWTVKSR